MQSKLIWNSCPCKGDPERGETITWYTFGKVGNLSVRIGDKVITVRKCPKCGG